MKRTTKPTITTGSRTRLSSGVHVSDFRTGAAITKYNDNIPVQVLQMAQVGMTIEQMAGILMVGLSTLESWISNRSAVREAYTTGKYQHDVGVEQTLLQRALGYEYEEVKHFEGTDSLGRPYERTVTTKKRVEPDTTALIFFLKNRNAERWRDTWNVNSNVSLNQVNINNTLKLETLNPQQREMLQDLAMKQIENMNGISGE